MFGVLQIEILNPKIIYYLWRITNSTESVRSFKMNIPQITLIAFS